MRLKVLSVLFFLIFIQLALSETLHENEETTIEGKKVIITGITQEKVKISVDKVTNIISANSEKVINGIKIIVEEITYSGDETSTVKLSFEALYKCGDNKCDETETKLNCCKDCGCEQDYTCDENKCSKTIVPECARDSDCEDNNPKTLDKCESKKCSHISICLSNAGCNDNNECTDDTCEDQTCFNIDKKECQTKETEEPAVNSEIKESELNETKSIEESQESKEDNAQEKPTEPKEKEGIFKKIFGFIFKILRIGEKNEENEP